MTLVIEATHTHIQTQQHIQIQVAETGLGNGKVDEMVVDLTTDAIGLDLFDASFKC